MINIKCLVSILTIIGCYHIKESNINTIEFENFTKLVGNERNTVIEEIIKNQTIGVSAINKIEQECIVFKNNNMTQQHMTQPHISCIFLFTEEIYKAQTDERIKKSMEQLDGKNIFLLVWGTFPDGNGSLKPGIIPTNKYNISKIE